MGIAGIAGGGVSAGLASGSFRESNVGRTSRARTGMGTTSGGFGSAGRAVRDVTLLGCAAGTTRGRRRAYLGFARASPAACLGPGAIVGCAGRSGSVMDSAAA